jgi:hypothetical protein
MAIVRALQGFTHNGDRQRGAKFYVSDLVAMQLRDKGLVAIESKGGDEAAGDPSAAAGDTSSASQAAPASRQTTAKKSAGGGKQGKGGPSS